MAAGTLLKAYAYEVAPRQVGGFNGGAIPVSSELEAALNSAFDRSKVSTAPVVNFKVDTASPSRAHVIRDAALSVAFTSGPHDLTAEGLAQRLAASMDNRSKAALLMMSVHDAGVSGEKRVLLWTFPQQEVFNLGSSNGKPKLELLEAFNRESSLRKVALVEGPNAKTGMLTARVLDFQATAAERSVADLWTVRFLEAQPQMGSTEGTRLLAQALRAAHTKTADDQHAQDQILAAIASLRVTPNPKQTLDQVAATYMTGAAAEAFRSVAGPPEARGAIFTIDAAQFDRLVQYTRFELDSGVVVSAPFDAISADGGSVRVSESSGERRLSVEGKIEGERVRNRA